MPSMRLPCWLVALVTLAVGCSSKSDSTTKRVIFVTNGVSPFWDACRAGLQAGDKEFDLAGSGLQAVMDVNNGTPKGQVDKLRQYANETDIAAVAISVTDVTNTAIQRELENLQKQGIKVICVDSDVDRATARGSRYAYIGTDNIEAGREIGKVAKALRPEGGPYATFVGLKGAGNAIERHKGFQEGAGDTFKLAESLGDNFDLSVARKNVRDALGRDPPKKCLVGIWSYNAPAIAEIVEDKKVKFREEGGIVVAFDAEPTTITHMEKGSIDAIIVQNPYEMGRQARARLMKALVTDDQATLSEMLPKHGQPDGDILITGLKVVVPDSQTTIKADLFGPNTQFLKLSEFKAWLAKYQLTGS